MSRNWFLKFVFNFHCYSILISCLLFISCEKEKDDASNNDTPRLELHVNRQGNDYLYLYNVSSNKSFSATVNDVPLVFESKANDVLFYYISDSSTAYNPGQEVNVELNHDDWGSLDYKVLIPDYWPGDSIRFEPSLSEWYNNISDQNSGNDELTVQWDSLEYAGYFELYLYAASGTKSIIKTAINNSFVINPLNCDNWDEVVNEILDKKAVQLYVKFMTREELKWGDHALVNAIGFSYSAFNEYSVND